MFIVFTLILSVVLNYLYLISLGLQVKTTHLSYPRKYKVKGVTVKPASSLRYMYMEL